jgi:hypothetical protein
MRQYSKWGIWISFSGKAIQRATSVRGRQLPQYNHFSEHDQLRTTRNNLHCQVDDLSRGGQWLQACRYLLLHLHPPISHVMTVYLWRRLSPAILPSTTAVLIFVIKALILCNY